MENTCLVDSSVLIALMGRSPQPELLAWAKSQERWLLVAVTAEEIWAALAAHQLTRHQRWFERLLLYRADVLPVEAAIARRAGELRGKLRAAGEHLPQTDCLVAATALENHLELVTLAPERYRDTGAAVVSLADLL